MPNKDHHFRYHKGVSLANNELIFTTRIYHYKNVAI